MSSKKTEMRTDNAPAPVGPYSQAIQMDGILFCSGQIAIDPRTNEVVLGDIKSQAKLVMENIKGILESAGCGMNDVVKVTAHLTNAEDFEGYNGVYKEYFSKPFPTRTTVQSVIPGGSLVEIDVIALLPERTGS